MKIDINDPSERTFGELHVGRWFRYQGEVWIKYLPLEAIRLNCQKVFGDPFSDLTIVQPLKNVQITAEIGMEP